MKKHIISLIVLLLLGPAAIADSKKNGISQSAERTEITSDSISEAADSLNNTLDSLATTIDSEVTENDVDNARSEADYKAAANRTIDSLQTQLDSLSLKIESAEGKIAQLTERNRTIETKLALTASNLLYIPYDEYSVENFGIALLRDIQDPEIKEKVATRLELLTNYGKDIKALHEFLAEVDSKLLGIGDEPILDDYAVKLDLLPTTLRYKRYSDGANTTIGKLLKNIKKVLTTDQLNAKENIGKLRSTF